MNGLKLKEMKGTLNLKYIRAIALCLLLCPFSLFGQSFSETLASIERNNSELQALREEMNAEIMQAKTSLTPADPSIEWGYLWETLSPEGGHRIDLAVSQEFDFPSAYYWKNRLSKANCSIARVRYEIEKKNLLLEARKLCIHLVWLNAMQVELQRQRDYALQIEKNSKESFDAGRMSLIELNQAGLNLLNCEKALRENAIERNQALGELKRMNGGADVRIEESSFTPIVLFEDFDSWFERASESSSELELSSLESSSAEMEVKLGVADALPKFSIGYASERVNGSTLQGIKMGLSIPLWENKGKVKAAKARLEASLKKEQSSREQFLLSMQNKYNQTKELSELSVQFREKMQTLSSEDLMFEALQAGQIGLNDYLVGTNLWKQTLSEALSCERDAALLMCELEYFAK